MADDIAFELSHERRLIIITYPEHAGTSAIRKLISIADEGVMPEGFNALLDFSATRSIDFPVEAMIELSMVRRRHLPYRPNEVRKTAYLRARPALRDVLDAWESFFYEDPPALIFRHFDDREAALEWLTER
ncbi:hypothetical protein AB6B38_03050 [Glycocaulis abyssi]|uniref:STAS/SEC14 domain-containing protein n=1 Tax=Glycocaulis abyssi TaxID=1433403 RepID=A0ABV9NDG3_9PROT